MEIGLQQDGCVYLKVGYVCGFISIKDMQRVAELLIFQKFIPSFFLISDYELSN